ncbi:T9SS type A sorting domain-containing protein [Vicingaceae bacterium]|nr:T9SS type A sorting domain-containing protein [Vicingaceae bacterium]
MKYLSIIFISFLLPLTTAAQIYYSEAYNIEVTEENDSINDPFTGGFNNAQFSEIDLNQDGIMDLLVTDRFRNTVKPYLNEGILDSVQYTYAPVYAVKFPEMDEVLITRDYNDDGKMDLFVSGNSISLYENTSTRNGGLSFRLVDKLQTKNNATTLNVLNPNSINYPAIVDLEDDKDIDVIYRSGNRTLDYHRNFSIDQNNNFTPIYERRSPCWGYISFVFTSNFTLDSVLFNDCRFSPRGERTKGLKHSEGMSTTAIDIDQNGSMDLITSDIEAYTMKVMLNSDSLPGAAKVNSEIFKIIDSFPNYNTPVNLLMGTAYFIDVNNDGKKDLIASSSHANTANIGPFSKEEIWLYENTSSTGGYRFELSTKSFLQDKSLDFGRNAKPAFIDYNNDGLKDLLLGNGGILDDSDSNTFIESLALLRNIGTRNIPKFELISADYLALSALNFGITRREFANAAPAVGDIDGDGDEDFLLCQKNGNLYFFEDTSATGNEAEFKFHPTRFQGIKDISTITSAQLFDVDKDGLLDLITTFPSQITYFQNFGNAQNPIFNIQLDSIVWQNGDTIRYHIKETFQYSKINIGDSLAVDNTTNAGNNSSIALVAVKIDSAKGFIDCINTIPFGVRSNQYDEINTTATLNFFRRTWKIRRDNQLGRFENVFLFEDRGVNQFYAGGINNTTYRINSFIDSLQPIYDAPNTERIKMANYGNNMFINGTDLNGDSIMDLIVGLSTGGLKVLYGSRVNSISELSVFEEKQESAIRIYPNPTEGVITIELQEEIFGETNTIEIRSVSGQLALVDKLSGLKKQLDISRLSKGVYFIIVRNTVKTETMKLILRP